MKFQNLVQKKRSELQDLCDENDINYSSSTNRDDLIIKLSDDFTSKKKNLLALGADGVKNRAKEFGIEYTTKKETLSKIAEKLEEQKTISSSTQEITTWREEFEEAIRLAKRSVLSEKRSYKILEKEEKNTFNVKPTYMKHSEDHDLLMTIHITEKAKLNL